MKLVQITPWRDKVLGLTDTGAIMMLYPEEVDYSITHSTPGRKYFFTAQYVAFNGLEVEAPPRLTAVDEIERFIRQFGDYKHAAALAIADRFKLR